MHGYDLSFILSVEFAQDCLPKNVYKTERYKTFMKHHHHCNHESKSHRCCGGCCKKHRQPITVTKREFAFLERLAQIPFLPVARFLLRSTKSEHLASVALAPVHLLDAKDSMELVKHNGKLLHDLEHKGLITIDYDIKLKGFDYQSYYNSTVYLQFQETVAEAKAHPEFLYDIGIMECGSMALTARGYAAVDTLASRG